MIMISNEIFFIGFLNKLITFLHKRSHTRIHNIAYN